MQFGNWVGVAGEPQLTESYVNELYMAALASGVHPDFLVTSPEDMAQVTKKPIFMPIGAFMASHSGIRVFGVPVLLIEGFPTPMFVSRR